MFCELESDWLVSDLEKMADDEEQPTRLRGPGTHLAATRGFGAPVGGGILGEKLTDKEIKDLQLARARKSHEGGVAANAFAKFDNTLCTDPRKGMIALVKRVPTKQPVRGGELAALRGLLWVHRDWAKELVPSRPFAQFVRELRLVPETRWQLGCEMTKLHFQAEEQRVKEAQQAEAERLVAVKSMLQRCEPASKQHPASEQQPGDGAATKQPSPEPELVVPEEPMTPFRAVSDDEEEIPAKRPRTEPKTPVGSRAVSMAITEGDAKSAYEYGDAEAFPDVDFD